MYNKFAKYKMLNIFLVENIIQKVNNTKTLSLINEENIPFRKITNYFLLLQGQIFNFLSNNK